MARHDVMTKVPVAQYAAANAFLVGLFGDDPGSEEIALNAYLDGEESSVSTYSIGVCNCSQSDTNALVSYMSGAEDCASNVYATAGSGADFWADALSLWNLRPTVPITA